MQHTYDAGTWRAEVDGHVLWVERDAVLHSPITVTVKETVPRHIELSLDQARALVQMLTEALEAVKEEE